MNKFLTFITVFFLHFSFLNAEIVNNIEIEGNSRISNETIKVYGGIQSINKDFTKFQTGNLIGTITVSETKDTLVKK